MTEKSMIIIGAGLAGLSTGVYAQTNGYRSKIFEHADHPGGLATCWKKHEYLIDGGIHFVMGSKPDNVMNQMYRELGTASAESLIPMTTYGRYFDLPSNKRIDVTRDLDKLAKDLRAISPADKGTLDHFFWGVKKLRRVSLDEMGISEPTENMSVLDRLRQFWRYRSFIRFMIGRYSLPIEQYVADVSDPFLKAVIRNLFLPEVPVWFVLMVLRLLEDGQMALLRGGCDAFVRPIERRYKELGGQITYEATVEKVIVENDRAVGVKLSDGSEHRVDIVISAADGHSTIFDLLEGRYMSKRIKRRYASWRIVRPIIIVSFGVDREFKDDPWLTVLKLARPFMVGPDRIDMFALRLFNYSDKFAPPGKTVVQVILETNWDYWDDLRLDLPKYDAEKERISSEVLSHLEGVYPGIASQVEVTDVATPFTTWRYTLNYRGSYMGWLPTPKQFMTRMEYSLPGLSNFYMVGQWNTPGGGVPSSLASGRNLIRILCYREHRPFRSPEA